MAAVKYPHKIIHLEEAKVNSSDYRRTYDGYRVVQLTNTIDFSIGQGLFKKEVKALLRKPEEWIVIVGKKTSRY